MLLNNQWVTKNIKGKIKKKNPEDKWKWKYNISKSVRDSRNSSKKEVDNDTDLPQKARKVSSTLSSNLKTRKQRSKHISKLDGRK